MKKISLYTMCLGALLFASCSKNQEQQNNQDLQVPEETREIDENTPEEADEGYSILAYVEDGDVTKTSYDGETTFRWEGNEIISMQLIKKTATVGTRDRWLFYNSSAAGTKANFRSTGTLSTSDWDLSTYAFYPAKGNDKCPPEYKSWDVGEYMAVNSGDNEARAEKVEVSNYVKASVSNPMQYIPLIGVRDDSGNYAFHTATGILKITVSDIDARLAKVQLYSEGQKLNGTYTLTESGKDAYIAMTTTSTASEQVFDAKYTDWASQTSLSFYFPVPVGTLNSGFQIRLLASDDNVLYTATAPSAVTIVRNTISEITTAIPLPAKTPPGASSISTSGANGFNEPTVTFTHNDAPKIKYGFVTSSTATLSSLLTTTTTEENNVVLAPPSTGTWYLVYRGYESDGTTPVGQEKRVPTRFLYVSNNVSDIAGVYYISSTSNNQYRITILENTPVVDGKNVRISVFNTSNNSYSAYNGASGSCLGSLNFTQGTITFNCGQSLVNNEIPYYIVSKNTTINSKETFTATDTFVLSLVETENNAGLRFNCNNAFCITPTRNNSEAPYTYTTTGLHWSGDYSYFYRPNNL